MTTLTDETKRVLTYVLVTISGGLLVVNGSQDGSTFSVAGGALLVVAAIGLLLMTLSGE